MHAARRTYLVLESFLAGRSNNKAHYTTPHLRRWFWCYCATCRLPAVVSFLVGPLVGRLIRLSSQVYNASASAEYLPFSLISVSCSPWEWYYTIFRFLASFKPLQFLCCSSTSFFLSSAAAKSAKHATLLTDACLLSLNGGSLGWRHRRQCILSGLLVGTQRL